MLLEISNVSKTYISGSVAFKALDNISVNFDRGEFSAVIGPSGSGKTTLLNCIGCIDRPDNGSILFNGINLTQQSSKTLAQIRKENFGFIFQTYNLIPILTVFENIELPLKLLNYSSEQIKHDIDEILNKVGLSGLEKRKPLELSGGQQQRVSIARALIKKPQLILADEPTANLDSKTGQDIIHLMHKLNQEEKVTFLFSTHDPMVIKNARRVVEIRDGKIFHDSQKKLAGKKIPPQKVKSSLVKSKAK